jgi:hypothetical protein
LGCLDPNVEDSKTNYVVASVSLGEDEVALLFQLDGTGSN